MIVCLLKSRAGVEVRTACGALLRVRDGRQPVEVSVWESEVSCPDCRPRP